MRKSSALLMIQLVLLTPAEVPAQPPAGETIEQRHKRVCDNYGSNRAPNPEISAALKAIRTKIWQVADKYGVDPAAIVGSILAEHSNNTSGADHAQNLLAKIGGAGLADRLGVKMTYGFGQLHVERAVAAEAISAGVYKRPVKSRRDVEKYLLTAEGSIDYVGALVFQAQSMYARNGYNISRDPGVLTTLYNIGKIQQRIDRTKKENRMPSPNYFGCWVEKHIGAIRDIAGPRPKTVQEKAAELAPKVAQDTAKTATPVKTGPMRNFIATNEALRLSGGPDGCFVDVPYGPGKELPAGTFLEQVGRGVECDGVDWLLMRSINGEYGWIKENDLKNKTKQVSVPASSCSTARPAACLKKLKAALGKYIAGETGEEVRISLIPPGTDVDASTFVRLEKDLSDIAKETKKGSKAGYDIAKGAKRLTSADADQLRKGISDFEDRLRKTLGMPKGGSLLTAANPYKRLSQDVDALEKCLETADSEQPCLANTTEVLNFLAKVPLKKAPTVKDLEAANSAIQLGRLVHANEVDRGKVLMAASQLSEARKRTLELLDQCESWVKSLPVSKDLMSRVRKHILVNYDREDSNQEYDYTDLIREKKETYSRFQTNANGMENIVVAAVRSCDALYAVQSKSDVVKKRAEEGTCQVPSFSAGDENMLGLNTALLSNVREMFNDPTSQDEYFAELMKRSLGDGHGQGFGDGPFATLMADERLGGGSGLTMRELIDRTRKIDCVKAIYVGDEWLVSGAKTVYRPMKQEAEIRVDYTATACKQQ